MDNWLEWVSDNPLAAAVLLLFGGPLAIAALTMVLVPVFILAEANAFLGLMGLLLLTLFGYFAFTTLSDDESTANEETTPETAADPITELEHRYVNGELSEAEFERRLERIIETEDTIERLDSESPLGDRARDKRETELN